MNIIEDKITTLHCSMYLREILIILHTYLHSFLTSVYLAIYDTFFLHFLSILKDIYLWLWLILLFQT